MATLTVSITSAAGTMSKTLTFSGADASRILAAFQNRFANPAMTQQDLVNDFSQALKDRIADVVRIVERVVPPDPVPPAMS
jgi:hypothetical protein